MLILVVSFFFFFFLPSFSSSFLVGEVFTWDKVLLYCIDCSLVSSNLLIQLLNAGVTKVAFIPGLVLSVLSPRTLACITDMDLTFRREFFPLSENS